MASRAEQYRQLARDCLEIAKVLPPGDRRNTVLDMAREWETLTESFKFVYYQNWKVIQ